MKFSRISLSFHFYFGGEIQVCFYCNLFKKLDENTDLNGEKFCSFQGEKNGFLIFFQLLISGRILDVYWAHLWRIYGVCFGVWGDGPSTGSGDGPSILRLPTTAGTALSTGLAQGMGV